MLQFLIMFPLDFQLSELHVYVIPRQAWEGRRNLASKDVVEHCVSVGFVR